MALTKKQRDGVVDAFVDLLADHPFDGIAMSTVAARAKVSLVDLAAAFPSALAIWEAFAHRIDQEVLKDDGSDMVEEIPRERLFDVMMRRFDALRPYRPALANLMAAARRDPALALALNRLAVRSHAWMLAVARIEPGGMEGRLLAQGSALTFARAMRTFIADDDPGMPKTMAALDRELRRAEQRWQRISEVFRLLPLPMRERSPGQDRPRPGAANGADTETDEPSGDGLPQAGAA